MKKHKSKRVICKCGKSFMCKPIGDFYNSMCKDCRSKVVLLAGGGLINGK